MELLEIDNDNIQLVTALEDNRPYFSKDYKPDLETIKVKEYLVDTFTIKCDVLSFDKKYLRENSLYKIEFGGFITSFWFCGLSRIDKMPMFSCEALPQSEYKLNDRIYKINKITQSK